MTDGTVLTGGCQCGAVRYRLTAAPEGAHVCHCRMCQKAVGGPYAALAPVRLEHFAWTRGTPGAFESSNLAFRDFCAACGTPLTFRYAGSGWIAASIGSLDEPDRVPPVRQYGTATRLHGFDDGTIASLPVADLTRAPDVVSHQHPDHDTPDGWTPRA